MEIRTNPLDRVKVAAPCSADWERMTGDDRTRFCHRCSLNVYNLSGMTRREAEALITNAEGRLCVRYYRRADGTVLTRNCPVGLSALKRRASRAARAVLSAALTFLAGLGLSANLRRAPQPEEALMGAYTVMPTVFEPPAPAFEPMPFNGPVGVEEKGEAVVMGTMVFEQVERVSPPPRERVRKARR